MENVRELQDLLGASTLEETFLKATEKLLDALSPRRKAKRREQRKERTVAKRPEPTRRPRREPISTAVRDAIHIRDGARCTHQTPHGRCSQTRYLEIDHIRPVALGGANTLENLRLLCRRHNQDRARRTFPKSTFPRATVPNCPRGQ
jgi:5-methylcytosine-specific restriction endonuclease McrA